MKTKSIALKTTLNITFSQSPRSFLSISRFFSTQFQSSSSSSSYRRYNEESKNVRVSVWWDFENCHVPAGVNVYRVAQTITAAVRANGIKGPVSITAFGDMVQLSRANQEALLCTGIQLTHIPHGGKNSADRSLLVDLMYWVSKNPPPAHIFLITGDRDFANVLHRLRMDNYNILLASTDTAPGVLCSAATIMWPWNALVRGESLTGRYFNQPPDGPYGSWYGHRNIPLEDPFASEQSIYSQAEELPETSLETKDRVLPKAVVKQIRHILSSFPKGISLTDLRSELARSNVGIDRDLYGYKKFTRFLLSLPHVLRIQYDGNIPCTVHAVDVKALDSGKKNLKKLKISNDEEASISAVILGSPSFAEQEPPKETQTTQREEAVEIKQPAKQLEMPMKQMEQPSLVGESFKELNDKQDAEGYGPLLKQESEVGLFRKIWKRWFGRENESSKMKENDTAESGTIDRSNAEGKDTLKRPDTCSDIPEKKAEKVVESPTLHEDSAVLSNCSSTSADSNQEDKITSTSESEVEGKSSSLFGKIINWCKVWRKFSPSGTFDDKSTAELKQTPQKHKVFSEDSFWRDMDSFMDSKRGMFVILKSKTRGQLAQNLQKEGPFVLRSLEEGDSLQLVDILISEKWVEECPSEASPFKIIKSPGKYTLSAGSHASNGLRSLFSNRTLQAESETRPGKREDKRNHKNSNAAVSHTISSKKSSKKSRSEILLDCQKLLKEEVKESPNDMVSFRRQFLEKYGYHLDIQKLGYKSLASLIRQIPGVKVEGTCVFSSRTATCSISDQPEALLKDDNDSKWEELGPVENVSSFRKDLQSSPSLREVEGRQFQAYPGYELPLSDDDLSGSDEESAVSTRAQVQTKSTITNDHESSLLQILDSWQNTNEANKKDKPQNTEGVGNSSKGDLKSSDEHSSTQSSKNESLQGRLVQKQKQQKKYSFVADPKAELINDILGSLSKSSESKMQS